MVPEGGAFPLKVTVPVLDLPPTTAVGETESELGTGGLRVRVVETDPTTCLAVIVTERTLATGSVLIVKFTLEAPAVTTTELGTIAFPLVDVRFTSSPPVGAGPVKVTVPVTFVPPVTDDGDTDTLLRMGGLIVKTELALSDPEVAVIVEEVELATGFVVIANVVEVAPAGIVIEPDTVALEDVEVMFTINPLAGAGPERLRVAVDDEPPTTVAGDKESVAGPGGSTDKVAFAVTP